MVLEHVVPVDLQNPQNPNPELNPNNDPNPNPDGANPNPNPVAAPNPIPNAVADENPNPPPPAAVAPHAPLHAPPPPPLYYTDLPSDSTASYPNMLDNPLFTPPIKHLTHAHHAISIKLTPKNYLLWHNQMSFFLKGQGLFGYVDGSLPCPSPFSPAHALWAQQDAAIVSTLISSLSDSVQPDAIGKSTSHALWDCLRNTYAKASTARTLYLRSELRDLKQNDLSISEYFNKAQFLRDELTAINKAPSPDDFLCQVLMNLRPEFSEMKSSVLARPDEPPFEEVKNLFLAAESMATPPAIPAPVSLAPPEPPSAHFTQRASPGSRPHFPNRGSSSNRSRFARGRSSQYQNRSQPRGQWGARLSCQLCGQQDHLATACPQFLNAGATPSVHSAVYRRSAPRTGSTWYPDTGASHHTTPDISQLQLHDEYAGSDRVHVGDGTGLSIAHVGSSKIMSNSRIFQLNHILHVPTMSKSLLSMQRFCADNNAIFEFTDSSFFIKDKTTQKVLIRGSSHNGLYVFPAPAPPALHLSSPCVQSRPSSVPSPPPSPLQPRLRQPPP